MGIFEKWVDWLRKRNLLTGVLMLYDNGQDTLLVARREEKR